MIANTSYYNNNNDVDIDNDNMIDVDNELLPFASTLLSQIESDPWYLTNIYNQLSRPFKTLEQRYSNPPRRKRYSNNYRSGFPT
ncbi:MAG: hypothetical protein WBX01_17820 [Nitrososphaeraceae archaeon]